VRNIYLTGNVCRVEDAGCWMSIGRAMHVGRAVFLGWEVFAGSKNVCRMEDVCIVCGVCREALCIGWSRVMRRVHRRTRSDIQK